MKTRNLTLMALIVASIGSCAGGSEDADMNWDDLDNVSSTESSTQSDFEAGYNYEEGESDDVSYKDESIDQNIDTESIAPKEIKKNHERKLIKTAMVEFEVENLDATQAGILKSTEKYNAYIASEEQYNSYGRENITIQVKVPVENFEAMLGEIGEGVEAFDNRSVSALDVTEEFVDIESRLKAKYELENQYIKLLDKANSVNDVLTIERELSYVREEIEAFEGRKKYLENASSFSTITISIYKVIPVEEEYTETFSSDFSNGFKSGWNGLVNFFIGLVTIWPFLILLTVALFIARARLRKIKRSKVQQSQV